MIASIGVFLLALLSVLGAVMLFVRAGQREREEEMQLRLRATGNDDALLAAGLRGERQIRNPLLRWACHTVWRTGIELEPSTVARGGLALLLLAPVALLAFGWLAGILIVGVLLLTGWFILNRRAAARRAQIVSQLPSFLESVVRVLAAGNTLEEAFAASARESPDPLRPLFTSIGRQVRLGAPIEGVLMEAAEIHQLTDLRVLSLAAAVNRKFGGSLRNILRSLIYAIRTRDTATRELRALTAETRFSAWVLSLIPAGIMFFILVQNPEYYREMWATSSGKVLLSGSVLLQLAGIATIFRMMRSAEDG